MDGSAVGAAVAAGCRAEDVAPAVADASGWALGRSVPLPGTVGLYAAAACEALGRVRVETC